MVNEEKESIERGVSFILSKHKDQTAKIPIFAAHEINNLFEQFKITTFEN
jgi:hypothetical protein